MGNALAWLLEPDCPAVRFLALRDLLGRPPDDPERAEAQRRAHAGDPIATILDAMHPDGYWRQPGAGYGRSSPWRRSAL